MPIIRTGLPIPVELINLVNSAIMFCLKYLTQMINHSYPDCDSHSLALLDLFLSSDASICSTVAFPPLGNSDHVVVSVSIYILTNSQWDAPFHHFLFLEGGLLVILIDCMIFLSPFLDVARISMSKVFFLARLNSGILCL